MKDNLKKIMTDLAAGHISQKEADILINPKKVENQRVETSVVTPEKASQPKKTQKRRTKSKKVLKNLELLG